MKVANDHDYLLESSRKTEIITLVLDSYEKAMAKPLPITFLNSIKYRVDNITTRTANFTLEGGEHVQPHNHDYW